MRYRVMDILLAASPYDSFLLEEAGQLSERVLGEFRNLDLHYGPGITAVATGEEALAAAQQPGGRFQLILSTLHLEDMTSAELARRVRAAGLDVPVVALAFDNRELKDFVARHDLSALERVFLWQGDARILVGIVKSVEDRRNVADDTRSMGVQVILVVEDNVRYYSSFLPTIYEELLHHSQHLLGDSLNLSHRILRMRARPKILLCTSYEEAWQAFTTFQDDILGVLSDVEFPRQGRQSLEAGLDLARHIRERLSDVPVLLHSSRPENAQRARALGADFLLKGSPLLLTELRRFLIEALGFGDFVFRLPSGAEVARASDLRSLEEALRAVPGASVAYHAERNHFSKWLKARTEFALAQELRPQKLSDFAGVDELRRALLRSLSEYRRERTQTVVADFEPGSFDASGGLYRIGGGSLGGKARGLAFVRLLLAAGRPGHDLPDVELSVPPAVVLGTDVFDRFLDQNRLRDFALDCDDDHAIEERFLAAPVPADVREELLAFLARVDYPLAVRSSSLLEDSQYQPFTGVYETYMLPNNHPLLEVRLVHLLRAVARVYASTFSRHAKAYVGATPYRLEEEKMAVILQRIAGAAHGSRFYPDLAGVARSHDFYPAPPHQPADGVAAVALGLGRTVVEGANCLRFCPRFPQHLPHLSGPAEMLRDSQREFWAVDLSAPEGEDAHRCEVRLELAAADADGTLAALASTYSEQDDTVCDGVSRPGVRLVTFAPILKQGLFPLAPLLEQLLELGAWGMGTPVEIEFAVTLSVPPGRPRQMAVLQLRPLALTRETEELELGPPDPARELCRSSLVLGHGRIDDLHDLLVVDAAGFDRAQSRRVAADLARFNAELIHQHRPYVLIGVGRWGSSDPWLGIPVSWDEISGARVIVEAGFRDFKVAPSQGTHFFQNLTSFHVGYFTVNPDAGQGFVDWEWLARQPTAASTGRVRHLRLQRPLAVMMDGRRGR
ncbi:MAG TPA: PEP/pyruvate-binding domain-containing protein, partial [Vicinamibacteria bacterium]|nr:PEP/pyruvate-binding domain-containing protein [Vicinamibacteria bacterium]